MARAVFLDRDGIINELVFHSELNITGAPFLPFEFKLISGVAEAIQILHRSGYLVVVISNQPDVAKGRMTMDSFEEIRRKLKEELEGAGAFLDAEYYCMHHPQAAIEQFKVNCNCRKPKPGLLLKAAKDHNIDMSQSWFVGDNLSDIEAGKSAGCQTILVDKMKNDPITSLPDNGVTRLNLVSTDLREAIHHIS